MRQEVFIQTRSDDEGVVIAAERFVYPTNLETPAAPLYRACNAIWEAMDRVATLDIAEVREEFIGDVYGALCHLRGLAHRIEERFAMEARMDERIASRAATESLE